MIHKNVTVQIVSNGWGKLSLNLYKETEGVLEYVSNYKLGGTLENVDIEINTPAGKRSEYAKITKIR